MEGGARNTNTGPGRAIKMLAEHLHMLQESAFLDHLLKFFPRLEEVVQSVHFSRPGRPGGAGYGKAHVVIALH